MTQRGSNRLGKAICSDYIALPQNNKQERFLLAPLHRLRSAPQITSGAIVQASPVL